MRAIIIGAGRGQRLMPTTANSPKCFAEVGGRRILDWILGALEENGVADIVYIGGYQIDQIKAEYPRFSYCLNDDWENNNILESLMYARDYMDEPFLTSYADILCTPRALSEVCVSEEDITLLVDTKWAERHAHRSDYPMSDGEKVTTKNGLVTRVHRDIDPVRAYGEFTGVARFSTKGGALLQEMIEQGVKMSHVDTPGEYQEIDTQQEFTLARQTWGVSP